MINESNLLNVYCTGIYDSTKALTETEIIMQILEKLNMIAPSDPSTGNTEDAQK